MSGFVNRFIKIPDRQECIENLFGTTVWKAEVNNHQDWAAKKPAERYEYLSNLYQNQLKAAGARYTFAFKIRSGSNQLLFHLVFGTKHIRYVMCVLDRARDILF